VTMARLLRRLLVVLLLISGACRDSTPPGSADLPLPDEPRIRRAAQIVNRHIAQSRGWKAGDYTIRFEGEEGAALLFVVRHSRDRDLNSAGGGWSSVMVYVDSASGMVLKEMYFQ
jgi:hypothetical protein